jgi:hypothetical protein
VLVQAFPLGLEWSNLPLLKAYVVMVHDWLAYVTAPTMARHNLSPGTPIVAASQQGSTSAMLVTPRGREIALAATDADVSPVYRFTQTRLPGTYRVRFSSSGTAASETPFHVAHDARESNLEPLNVADRDALLVPAGLQFAGVEAESAVETANAAPRREPFWSFLLAALVALLAGELLMSNWLARQRSGMAVSTT